MIDYSKMSSAEIADHIDADSHDWEWSVDEYGNDIEPKYGCNPDTARRASQEDEDMLAELLGKR